MSCSHPHSIIWCTLKSTPRCISDVLMDHMSDHKQNRRENLVRLGYGAKELSDLLGRTTQFWSDRLRGARAIGSELARDIETRLSLDEYAMDRQGMTTPGASKDEARQLVLKARKSVTLDKLEGIEALPGPVQVRAEGGLPRKFFEGSDVTIHPLSDPGDEHGLLKDGWVCLARKTGGSVVLGIVTLREGGFTMLCTDGNTYDRSVHKLQIIGRATSVTTNLIK